MCVSAAIIGASMACHLRKPGFVCFNKGYKKGKQWLSYVIIRQPETVKRSFYVSWKLVPYDVASLFTQIEISKH